MSFLNKYYKLIDVNHCCSPCTAASVVSPTSGGWNSLLTPADPTPLVFDSVWLSEALPDSPMNYLLQTWNQPFFQVTLFVLVGNGVQSSMEPLGAQC